MFVSQNFHLWGILSWWEGVVLHRIVWHKDRSHLLSLSGWVPHWSYLLSNNALIEVKWRQCTFLILCPVIPRGVDSTKKILRRRTKSPINYWVGRWHFNRHINEKYLHQLDLWRRHLRHSKAIFIICEATTSGGKGEYGAFCHYIYQPYVEWLSIQSNPLLKKSFTSPLEKPGIQGRYLLK